MSLRGFLTSLAVCCGLAALVPSAQAQRELPAISGPWSPDGVAVQFPEEVDSWVRSRIIEYGPDDWGVNYDLESGRNVLSRISVYVYRSHLPGGCAAEFDDAKLALEQYGAAEKLAEAHAPSPLGGSADTARLARYRLKMDRAGGAESVTSELYVYCRPGSEWTIKYRASWDAAENHAAAAPAILRAIGWASGLVE